MDICGGGIRMRSIPISVREIWDGNSFDILRSLAAVFVQYTGMNSKTRVIKTAEEMSFLRSSYYESICFTFQVLNI